MMHSGWESFSRFLDMVFLLIFIHKLEKSRDIYVYITSKLYKKYLL